MKQYMITLLLAFLGITGANAQRMLPGQKGLEVHAGMLSNDRPEKNYYLALGMNSFAKSGNYGFGLIEYNHQEATYKAIRIPLESYFVEGGYSLRLLGDARRQISLYASLSGVVGYQTINRGKQLLYDGSQVLSEEGLLYGGGGRLSLETYLCDRMVLLLQGRVRMLWGAAIDQFRPSAGLGLRFNF
ncbi:Conjugative transposon protein TraO [Chitinophaga eiseniae]|uniref:Conjugative transposon protein TraO n=1 Tax=Chitinophaga eiseniae TaxID=634771 RepID=A0A1T4SYF3_9BACT|nr:conjugal transfer protein TraO [Chitinophaga eiseniae]SKA33129.1 Conjugative transposon protein TraO [Chitinophaga eiseniae]